MSRLLLVSKLVVPVVMLLVVLVAAPSCGQNASATDAGDVRLQVLTAVDPARTDSTPADAHLSREKIAELSAATVLISAYRSGSIVSTGSGAILHGTNLVLTNRHVLEDADDYSISILEDPDEPPVERYRASVVMYSTEHDFGVVRIDRSLDGSRLPDAPLRLPGIRLSETAVQRGDRLFVFGYPGIGDGHLLFSEGTISAIQNGDAPEGRLPVWYRTNADISPGNSGGIAVTSGGRVIGVPTVVRSEQATSRRLGGVLSTRIIISAIKAGAVQMGRDVGGGGALSRAVALDFNLEPFFGDTSLAANFEPDPFAVAIMSGGEVDVAGLGGGCAGWAASAPDFRLSWSGQSQALRFFFEAQDGRDTTLIVNMPDGTWRCNDDAGEGILDPMVTLANPPQGAYDIWIGSYNRDEAVPGSLFITELDIAPGFSRATTPSAPPPGSASTSLNTMGTPHFGTGNLRAGFADDPHRVRIESGGSVDVASQVSGCTGYASSRPDYRVNWTGNGQMLRFLFEADAGGDTTLLVNLPDGTWLCNDDANPTTTNPMVTVNNPREGQYDVWVGSFNRGETVPGTLLVTEMNLTPGSGSSSGASGGASSQGLQLDTMGVPHFGTTSLSAGFLNDPHRVRVESGGAVSVASQVANCVGHTSSRPDYRLNWSGNGSMLRILFEADGAGDATILVNQPDGTWLCNDDAHGNTTNPMVTIRNPRAGQYDIWVGSYNASERIGGTLAITELDRTPR